MKKTYLLQTFFVTLIVPYITFARATSPTKFKELEDVVFAVVDVAQVLLIMATTLYLIYAGLMFVTARGEPAKLTKARDALLWGMVGAALILAARVLVTTLQSGVNSILK